MSEQIQNNPYERRDNANIFRLTMGGEQMILHDANTFIYEHEAQPDGDHVFIAKEPTETGGIVGIYLWKQKFITSGELEDYEEIVEILQNIGCNTYTEAFLTDGDLERYHQSFGKYPDTKGAEQHELTARHEKLVRAFGEVLRTCPDDMLYNFITDEGGDRPYPQRWA